MGAFCLVLHTHLPYLRRNGVWPSGEDLFHQAAVESYLPLLGMLEDLADTGARDALTIGITPVLAHQMRDDHMRRELDGYLGRWELRALGQVANYEGVFAREFRDLAAFYALFGRQQSELHDRVGDLASGFRALADEGVIEIIGGPATHPYLPLVREPALLRAQIAIGAQEHRRVFGRAPEGMWLPECAYAPGAGIEDVLSEHGVRHVVVDGPTMLRSAGPGSTFGPRRIGDSSVSAFARDLDVAYRVWSPTGGYPTGKWYRDFFAYDLEGGFKDWRVTSIRKPVEQKRPYEPERARAAAERDAEDFAALVARSLERYEADAGREGVVVAAYDTELFGHWWFEGPIFLRALYRILDDMPGVTPLSLAAARARVGDGEPIPLQAGTWGFRKDTRSWVAPETQHMWETLTGAEADTIRLLDKHTGATNGARDALAQIVREALLMESSDWPFMVLRGRNPEYARERFYRHHERLRYLERLLAERAPDDVLRAKAAGIFDADNILPDLDPDAIG